jgi:hypothetical protein
VLEQEYGIDPEAFYAQEMGLRVVSGTPAAPTATRVAKPASQRGPLDAARFLAGRGGIRDDQGHDLRRGRNLQKLTPEGPLIRQTGLSIDEAGEALWEAGFFGPLETTLRPDESQVLELLERTAEGRVFTPEEADAAAADLAAASNADQEATLREGIAATARDMGFEFAEADVDAALRAMAEDGLEIDDAVDLQIERLAMQTLDDLESETGDNAYDIPFDDPAESAEGDRAAGARRDGREGQPGDAGEGEAGGRPAEGLGGAEGPDGLTFEQAPARPRSPEARRQGIPPAADPPLQSFRNTTPLLRCGWSPTWCRRRRSTRRPSGSGPARSSLRRTPRRRAEETPSPPRWPTFSRPRRTAGPTTGSCRPTGHSIPAPRRWSA